MTLLTIGVASSALFDLTESERVFREQGVAAYREHQEKHKQKPAEHEEDERTIEH